MSAKRPTVVSVSGFSSNVGKTTLVCRLLQRLPGWEAIKLTRGHHRSCGRDPQACCVSDLIGQEAVVRSGREANYESGKDTGRFWDVGAVNVHWVIATDEQVERGIKEALMRVEAEGVIIEGNSFLEYIDTDFGVMCARAEGGTMKGSARAAIVKCDALFLSSLDLDDQAAREQFAKWRSTVNVALDFDSTRIFTTETLDDLVALITERKSTMEHASPVERQISEDPVLISS